MALLWQRDPPAVVNLERNYPGGLRPEDKYKGIMKDHRHCINKLMMTLLNLYIKFMNNIFSSAPALQIQSEKLNFSKKD